MATGKHAPNRLDRYLAIHATVMGHRHDEGFVLDDGLTLERGQQGYLMSGRIRCAGGLSVDVRKALRVVSGEGPTAMVQTVSYTYHVMLAGPGSSLNVFRYCGPHDDEAHPEHKAFHHKHTYDVLHGDVAGSIARIDDDAWPTLGDVLEEMRGWYAEHSEEIETLRRS